jgi:hypothetical protein
MTHFFPSTGLQSPFPYGKESEGEGEKTKKAATHGHGFPESYPLARWCRFPTPVQTGSGSKGLRFANLSSSELPQQAFILITVMEIGKKVNAFKGFRLYTHGDTCY